MTGTFENMPEFAMNMHQYAAPMSPMDIMKLHESRHRISSRISQKNYYEYHIPQKKVMQYTNHPNAEYNTNHSNFGCTTDPFFKQTDYPYTHDSFPCNYIPHNDHLSNHISTCPSLFSNNSAKYVPGEFDFLVFNTDPDDSSFVTIGDFPAATESHGSPKGDGSTEKKASGSIDADSKLEAFNVETVEVSNAVPSSPKDSENKSDKVFKCTEKVFCTLYYSK